VTVVADGEPPAALALVDESGAVVAGDLDLGLAAADLTAEARDADAARRAELDIAGVRHDVFVEPVARPMLWIHGGGHVSLELAEIAVRVGFRIGVVDDRVEFANPKRFPMASVTVAAPFPRCLERVDAGPRDHHVIVTRGHHEDETVLRWALARPAGSVGMIGSRRKVRTIFDRLRADGVPEEDLRRVRAPVGLHLGATTASEIALAIAAELVAIRRLGPGDEETGRALSLRRS
jgi:xanthine dehydrogenase accessory factor